MHVPSARKSTRKRQPAVFIGHGVPLNALEVDQWTREWAAFGDSQFGHRLGAPL